MLAGAVMLAAALTSSLDTGVARCAPFCARVDSSPSLPQFVFADTNPRRRRAIEYSDWYYRRLLVHRIGSYTMIPLFAAQWSLGNQLIHGADPRSNIGTWHDLVAGGVAVLFTVNTATGLWNLWDSRADPSGRTRRFIHSGLMIASDAGFLWTGAVSGQAKRSNDAAIHHRNIALGSISLSTVGAAMMWFWKN